MNGTNVVVTTKAGTEIFKLWVPDDEDVELAIEMLETGFSDSLAKRFGEIGLERAGNCEHGETKLNISDPFGRNESLTITYCHMSL